MTVDETLDIFEPWTSVISTKWDLDNFVRDSIRNFPKAFFVKPASSTGKYHPSWANEEGGLVKHTVKVLQVWDDLYRVWHMSHEDDENMMYTKGVIAIIFHDCCKYDEDGESEYTLGCHDVLSCKYFWKAAADWYSEDECKMFDCMSIIMDIGNAIMSHHGPWTTSRKPRTALERMVFLADYIASRKYINFNEV